jgi:putative peptidoglycan lipid II flippase
MIVAAGVFGPRHGVIALAVGFVVGSAARLLAQLVPLRQLGVRLLPALDLGDPGFRTIARLVPPLLLGSAVGNANTLVDRAVASVQGEGTLSDGVRGVAGRLRGRRRRGRRR